jgi:hypothetical protein
MFQSLRTRLRNWLGLEHFQALILDEVRNERQERVRQMDAAVQRLREGEQGLMRRTTSIASVRREVEELGIMTRQTASALGGVWQTAAGHKAPIVMLTDTHLQAILDGGFGGRNSRELIRNEQARRKEDDSWARKLGGMSQRERITALEVLATVPQDSPRGRDLARVIYRRQPACQRTITGRMPTQPNPQPRGQEYERKCNVVLESCDYTGMEQRALLDTLRRNKQEIMRQMRDVNQQMRDVRNGR